MSFQKVCTLDDVWEGEMNEVEVEETTQPGDKFRTYRPKGRKVKHDDS